jgi:hypothetical protein
MRYRVMCSRGFGTAPRSMCISAGDHELPVSFSHVFAAYFNMCIHRIWTGKYARGPGESNFYIPMEAT